MKLVDLKLGMWFEGEVEIERVKPVVDDKELWIKASDDSFSVYMRKSFDYIPLDLFKEGQRIFVGGRLRKKDNQRFLELDFVESIEGGFEIEVS